MAVLIQRNNDGFTLLEALVVTLIISVVMGLAVLSVSSSSRRDVDLETERLQQMLQDAADEAVFQKKVLGIVLNKREYSIVAYNASQQKWENLQEKQFRVHQLPNDVTVALRVNGSSIVLSDEAKVEAQKPSAIFYPTGIITSFQISISRFNDSVSSQIRSDGISLVSHNEGVKD